MWSDVPEELVLILLLTVILIFVVLRSEVDIIEYQKPISVESIVRGRHTICSKLLLLFQINITKTYQLT